MLPARGVGRVKSWEDCLGEMSLEIVKPWRHEAERDPRLLVEEAVCSAGIAHFLRRASERAAPVTVLLNDPDRFTDSRTALDLVENLARPWRHRERFRVLFATGTHTFTEDEKARHEASALPPAVRSSCEVAWHDARDPETVLPAGDAMLHHWVVRAESLLVVGSSEPHYFAGVTGAHKTATVGVMDYESVRANHYHALSARAAAFVLEGNPVVRPLARLLRDLGEEREIFAVNEVLVDRRLVACTAGPPLEAVAESLPFVRQAFSHRVSRPVDLIVARVAPPLDKSLYQADKAVKNVENAVRDGGVILLEAELREGVGIDRFLKMMEKAPTHAEALARIRAEGYQLGDHKAVRLRALSDTRAVRLGLVSSGLSEHDVRIAGFERFTSREEAALWAVGCLGGSGGAAILVEDAGNMTLLP